MTIPRRIEYRIAEGDIVLPRMFLARQRFPRQRLADVPAGAARAMAALPLPELDGKRIALTGSSRGIAGQAEILKAVAGFLKERGARPFIVPGMGSHGGASAEGQAKVLAGYGITGEAMGVPVLSGMEVVELGVTGSGFTVYCDRYAAEADYILPVNRVKPHTDFKGPVESGMCKMLVIGLGKHRGAAQIHRLGVSRFRTLIPEAAQVFVDSGKVLGGVAIIENAYDETQSIEAVPADRLVAREKELLRQAGAAMARLQLDAVDLLAIEEIGKDISGTGMDSNVTGRAVTGEPGFRACPIGRIAVLGISEKSQGSATGIGAADVVTAAFMEQVDLGATYTNCITGRCLESARVPLIANSDLDAVRIALFCCFGIDPAEARIAQIANTLKLSELRLSEAYLGRIREDDRFEVLSEPMPMRFDAAGRLARLGEG